MTRRVLSVDVPTADEAAPLISKVEKIEGAEPGSAEVDWHPPTMAKTSPKIETIKLVDLVRDPDLNCRVKIDPETVDQYAEALDRLPPISVFQVEGQLVLVDGWHRVAAHEKKNKETIQTTVYKGTRRDALLFAVGANAGLRRTQADKRRAVRALLADPKWRSNSDRWIADQCAVGHGLVASVRVKVDESSTSKPRRGKDGKSYRPKRIAKGAAKRERRSKSDKVALSVAGGAAALTKRAKKSLKAIKVRSDVLSTRTCRDTSKLLSEAQAALAEFSEFIQTAADANKHREGQAGQLLREVRKLGNPVRDEGR